MWGALRSEPVRENRQGQRMRPVRPRVVLLFEGREVIGFFRGLGLILITIGAVLMIPAVLVVIPGFLIALWGQKIREAWGP